MELSFSTGQIINVYGEMDDDGFYMGEIDGVRGLVPSNFLTEAPEQYGAGQTSQSQSNMGRGGQRGGRGIGPGARGPPPPPRDSTGRNRKQGIVITFHLFSFFFYLFFLIFKAIRCDKFWTDRLIRQVRVCNVSRRLWFRNDQIFLCEFNELKFANFNLQLIQGTI